MRIINLFCLSIIICLFCSNYCLPQNQASYWYYGSHTGLYFDGTLCFPDSIYFVRPLLNYYSDYYAAISDEQGQLLLYTNGDSLYNGQHKLVNNGFLMFPVLNYDNIWYQPMVFVPNPENPNIYYLVGANMEEKPGWGFPMFNDVRNGLRYSVIDIAANNNEGEVIEKNMLLYKNTCDKLEAIHHSNGKDIWIISHDIQSDAFRTYLVTKDGFSAEPVITNIGDSVNSKSDYQNMQFATLMKISPDGKKIFHNFGWSNGLQLFDFDNTTGKLSNFLKIKYSDLDFTAMEFSPDGKKIYGATVDNLSQIQNLVQIDITKNNIEDIVNSRTIIDSLYDSSNVRTTMNLTPNGKILVMYDKKNYLGSIECPNLEGKLCNFVKRAKNITLRPNSPYHRNVNFVRDWLIPKINLKATLSTNAPVCKGEEILLNASDVSCGNYLWWGPDSFQSSLQNPFIPSSQVSNSGLYYCKISSCENEYIDSIYVKVNKIEEPVIISLSPFKNNYFCPDDSIEVFCLQDYSYYLWSTGDTSKYIFINKPGHYSLTVIDSNGCSDSTYINLFVIDSLIQIIDAENLSFPTTIINQIKTKGFIIKNISDYPVIINDIHPNSSNSTFRYNSPSLPISLYSGESKTIFIDFEPIAEQLYTDSLIISTISPCNQQYSVLLSGIGKSNFTVIFSIPDTSGYIGDENYKIPVYAHLLDDNSELTINNLNIDLKFYADLYYPKDYYEYSLIDAGIYHLCNLHFFLDSIRVSNIKRKIYEITGSIFLSSLKKTPILFDKVSFNNVELVNDTITGFLATEDICVRSLRDIQLLNTIEITILYNSKEESLEIISNYNLNHEIVQIFSITGNKIYETKFNNTLDIASLPTGVYFVRIANRMMKILKI